MRSISSSRHANQSYAAIERDEMAAHFAMYKLWSSFVSHAGASLGILETWTPILASRCENLRETGREEERGAATRHGATSPFLSARSVPAIVRVGTSDSFPVH